MSLIKINPDKCVSCFQCARVCPVHAIRVTVGIEHPEIDDNRCIGCGTCIRACSYDAITYRSSTEYTKELLKSEQKVAAIVDPSISGELFEYLVVLNF
jgi:formate hydrogenlyase subunit 6/NADH:ubiquinone oxidoreductase subunit I